MIGPPALGAGPIVRPFFNRGPTGPPPDTIQRTALGTDTQFSAAVASLTIPGLSIPAGSTLMGALAFNNQVAVDDLTIGCGGATENGGVRLFGSGSTYLLRYFYFHMNQAPYSGDLVFDFSTSSGQPTVATAFAISVTGLLDAPLDRNKNAVGTSGTQDSGLTAVTTQAHEYLLCCIATTGKNPTDTRGTWQAGVAAGQRCGGGTSATVDLKEGWAVVNATGTYRAQVTGATSKPYGAMIQTFKGA